MQNYQNKEISLRLILNIIFSHKILLSLSVLIGIITSLLLYNFRYEYQYEVDVEIKPFKKLHSFSMNHLNEIYIEKYTDLDIQKMLVLNKLNVRMANTFSDGFYKLALDSGNTNCAKKFFKNTRYEKEQYKYEILDQYILFEIFKNALFQHFSSISKNENIGYKVDDNDQFEIRMKFLSENYSYDKDNMNSIISQISSFAEDDLKEYTYFCFNLLNENIRKFLRIYNLIYLSSQKENYKINEKANTLAYNDAITMFQDMIVNVHKDIDFNYDDEFTFVDVITPIRDLRPTRSIVPVSFFLLTGILFSLIFACLIIILIRINKK